MVGAVVLALAAEAVAQDGHGGHGEHAMPVAPLGLPMQRIGSGTSWLPDSSPMYMLMTPVHDWWLSFHENVFGQVAGFGGPRGDVGVDSINWFMGMAQGPVLGGQLLLRLMMSAEPGTVGQGGYPLLLQTGEGLVDAQHPHDLFMEMAGQFRVAVSPGFALSIYGGPVGEPALGPTAFPHRLSAWTSPLAPLTHHWIDSTHIAFGVLTVGGYTRQLQVELSAFNGREPSRENRLDLEIHPIDSLAGRVTVAPHRDWVAQVSAARLVEPEAHTHELIRATASVSNNTVLPGGGNLATTLVGGLNAPPGALATGAGLLESSWDDAGPNVAFGRAEVVGKSAEELLLPGGPDRVWTVGSVTLGYTYELPIPGPVVVGVGGQAVVDVIPASLAEVYGTRVPGGGVVFVRLWPRAMRMGGTGGRQRDPISSCGSG